ncbi:glycosyltransferase family 2 protein [Lutibacter sp.]|uniref:glycosyltransferase family 2 protein n=1 Tax=Lutibacter sp. TaxID=1925666 RepID=UPI002734419C|nr:glycosyltransferase family A protein [Lutibacter sp.]MDP3312594.1 glycosyltransferase family A protein [Lutibacter sp.]
MLFRFLKYIQPTNYFILFKYDNSSCFPMFGEFPENSIVQFQRDEGYSCKKAKEYDMSWQAIQYGYIGDLQTIANVEKLPLQDEYRFVRKYFNPIWASYCLLIRILSFKNPITEFRAFLKSSNVKRKKALYGLFEDKEWLTFESELLKSLPKISVIIPTLNRYEFLKKVLQDFELQDYTNFEIIIVDQSDNFNADFYKQFKLDIQLIRQEEKALWLARNTAIKHATGSIIALSEDDVRISHDWLTEHIKCLDFFKADISAGVFYPEGKCIPKERSYFAIAKQFATGNAVLYKDVFKKVGLFDRQFEKGRMGDGAFGLRCYLAGLKSISNPYASCIDVKANTGGLRELGSWDAYRTTNWLKPRPIPSVLYYYRMYFGTKLTILELLKSVPPSMIPYQFKRNKKMVFLGVGISILIFPLIIFQVIRSWKLASVKLNQGPIIDEL